MVSKLIQSEGKRWLLKANIDSLELRLRELEMTADRSNILSVYYFDEVNGSMEHYEKLSPIRRVHSFSAATFKKAEFALGELGIWAPQTRYEDCTYDEFYSRMENSAPSHVVSTMRFSSEHNDAKYYFEIDLEMNTAIMSITSDSNADFEKLARPFSSMIEAEIPELEYIARLLRLDQLMPSQ